MENRKGKELCFITPIILGGNPRDKNNQIFLNRYEHIQYVKFWNKKIKSLKNSQK